MRISVTEHLWQSHEMGPFSYWWWVQVWFSKLLHIEKSNGLHIPRYYSMNGGALKFKIFLPHEVGSDLPVTMWYFEHSFGVVCKVPLRSSSYEGFCLFSPEETYWLIVDHMCEQQDYISWLVIWSIQQFTSNWKRNAPAWVFICWYRTLWWFFKYWPFDEELRASFPFLQAMLNLTLEHCQSSDSWILVSLLPDLEVSDLEK
jgi:hypothetical protein